VSDLQPVSEGYAIIFDYVVNDARYGHWAIDTVQKLPGTR